MSETNEAQNEVNAFSELAAEILIGGAYKATKFLSEKRTIKATRRLYKYNGRKIDKRARAIEILFTIGRPNYEERETIKRAKRHGDTVQTQVKFAKK